MELCIVFQLGYTTVFGFHCAFLFLRTGSVYPPLMSHVFCNFMGLPDLGNEVKVFPRRKLSKWIWLEQKSMLIDADLICIYVLGIAGYVYGLRNWTLAEESLYWSAGYY